MFRRSPGARGARREGVWVPRGSTTTADGAASGSPPLASSISSPFASMFSREVVLPFQGTARSRGGGGALRRTLPFWFFKFWAGRRSWCCPLATVQQPLWPGWNAAALLASRRSGWLKIQSELRHLTSSRHWTRAPVHSSRSAPVAAPRNRIARVLDSCYRLGTALSICASAVAAP